MSTITAETVREQFMATITDGLADKNLANIRNSVGTPYNTPVSLLIEDAYCSCHISAMITEANPLPSNPNKYVIKLKGIGSCKGIHIKGKYDVESGHGEVIVTHLG